MTVLGAVEVLEDWLQMNASNLDSPLVFLQNWAQSAWVSMLSISEVLTSSEQSVVLGNGWNAHAWSLVNTLGGEGLVN